MPSRTPLVIGHKTFHNERVPYVKYKSNYIYLVGAQHTDLKYVVVVEKVIRNIKPDLVGVELCRTRIGYKNAIARQINKYREFDFDDIPKHKRMAAIGEKLRLLYVYGAIQYARSKAFRVVLARYKLMRTYRLTTAVKMDDVKIGAELYVPFRNLVWRGAHALGGNYLVNSYTPYKILLLDRPVEQTYQKLAQALSKEEKELVTVYKNDFQRYFKDGYGILMSNMWSTNPQLKAIFLHQRDEHMAHMLHNAVIKHKFSRIICVVGKSHIKESRGKVYKYKHKHGLYSTPVVDRKVKTMNSKDLQELCEFFHRLNSKEDGLKQDEEQIYTFDGSLENINKFNDFLQGNGGHTGGWGDLEHSTFLKLVKKHTLSSVIYLFRMNFPDLSDKEIIRHNNWYNNYIKLKGKQEHALRYWRIKKTEDEQERKDVQSVTQVKISHKPDESVKFKIQKWKDYRKSIKEEAEKKIQQQQQQRAEEEKARKIRHVNKKKMILEYKAERRGLLSASKLARQIEEAERRQLKAKRANKMLRFYRKKDTKLIQNAELKKKTKLQKEEEKKRVLELLASKTRQNIRVSRDPIRLLIPTVEWRHKMSKKPDPLHSNMLPAISRVQHLTTPEWRKALNSA